MTRILTGLFAFALLFHSQFVSADNILSTLEERIVGLQHQEGFFDLYWDESTGQLLVAIDAMGESFIYQSSMPRGIGSNDLLLDRGQLGATRLVNFLRSGPRVLLIEQNTEFRANSDNQNEADAVASSFARSVLWGFDVEAETDGVILVDATEFFKRDAHDISAWLSRAQQGQYRADSNRSVIFADRTRAFPDNTEIEAIVTYLGSPKPDASGNPTSNSLGSVVPDVTSVTVHLHHSFIRLPEDGYEPLPFDPRAGMIDLGFSDYSSLIGTPLETRYGWRHRLQKADPSAPMGPAIEPIVYYVDSGAPEPIRSALVEGASWWNEAFEVAGFENAFQVKILPPDADPMDVRYNVIQWVHRSSRGWSYGSSILDPRTGEILKGHVTLGSLRVRQDFLIAEGLLAPYADDTVPDDMLEMSLARIRQLSAHEVGHTIGIEHNFAASVNDRASVMDYPFPLIRFDANGEIDLSDAYGTAIGEWDKRTVNYAYRDFPTGSDAESERQEILRATREDGLLFVADRDSRNPGTAHPYGNLWDNGADAVEELQHLLKVRAHALQRFSENNIRQGRSMATLEEVLVPIYLLHRYQIQAVGKLIGGEYFTYALRGDGQDLARPVSATRQREAISSLFATLDTSTLEVPEHIVALIPPRPPGRPAGRESFARATGVTFDPLAPPASAVSLSLDVLLDPLRAARMNRQHQVNEDSPDFGELLLGLTQDTWKPARADGRIGAIERQSATQVLNRLMALQADVSAPPLVRAQALASVRSIDAWLVKQRRARLSGAWAAHYAMAQTSIQRMLGDPAWQSKLTKAPVPPGSPIGN